MQLPQNLCLKREILILKLEDLLEEKLRESCELQDLLAVLKDTSIDNEVVLVTVRNLIDIYRGRL